MLMSHVSALCTGLTENQRVWFSWSQSLSRIVVTKKKVGLSAFVTFS